MFILFFDGAILLETHVRYAGCHQRLWEAPEPWGPCWGLPSLGHRLCSKSTGQGKVCMGVCQVQTDRLSHTAPPQCSVSLTSDSRCSVLTGSSLGLHDQARPHREPGGVSRTSQPFPSLILQPVLPAVGPPQPGLWRSP